MKNISDSMALRQIAEARLKVRPVTPLLQTEVDLRRLQHELEVHQIELEMQNEELRAANAEIEAGLERYTDLFDFAPIGYFSLTKDATIRLVNLAGAKFFGVERSRFLGTHFDVLVDENFKNLFKDFLAQVFDEGTKRDCEVALARPGLPPVYVRLDGRRDLNCEHCRLAMIDVSERKRVEGESRKIELERQILETSAEERRRVGHELHDGLGQHLAGLAYKAKVLQTDLVAESSSLAADAEKIVGLINEAILQTRHVAGGFDPVGIEVGGLQAALQQLTNNTSSVDPTVTCIFQCHVERLNFDRETNLALFRIAQESIHNAMRYGRAGLVEIELGRELDGKIYLRVRDNGKGFSPETKLNSGMGLRIMQFRANSIGGTLTISSAPGHGTGIRCLVPAAKD